MPGTAFPAGTKIVYAVWACRGMYPGLEMVNKWYLNGQEYGSSTISWDRPDERGRWWVSLSRQSGAPLPSGDYQLELYVEGRMLQSGTFVIQWKARVRFFAPADFGGELDDETEEPANVRTSFHYGLTRLYASWP